MVIYKYLFYKFYLLGKFISNGGASALGNAFGLTILFLGLNIISVSAGINLFLKKISVSDILLYIVLSSMIVFVYYKSMYRDKFFIYNDLFSNQSKNKKLLGTLIVIAN